MQFTEQNKQALIAGLILGVAILVVLILVGFMFVLDEARSAQNETERLQTQIRQDRQNLSRIESFLEDDQTYRQVEEAFARVSARLPSDQDPFETFETLRGYFEGTAVTFTRIEPRSSENRGRYTEYPFTIRGSARYHEFGQLVNLIECDPNRLMHVTNFRLQNSERRPSLHPMEVGIVTFSFN